MTTLMQKDEDNTLITLTAQQLIDAWKGGYKSVKKVDDKGYWEDENGNMFCEGIKIIDDIYIKSSFSDKLPSIFVKNSKFKNFQITECTMGAIEFTNTKVELFNVALLSKTDNIRIEKSQISKLKISNNSIIEDISISETSIGTLSFFNNVQILRDIRISNTSIEDELSITLSNLWALYLHNTTLIKGVFRINNSKLYWLHISSKEGRQIEINKSYIQIFEWQQNSFCILNIDECKIEQILLNQSIIPKDSVFQLANCTVNTLIFNQFINAGWLNIVNLKPLTKYERLVEKDGSKSPSIVNEEIEIERKKTKIKLLYNKHEYEQVLENSILYLKNSDLGKTSFVSCDLNDFSSFVFYNTKMLEVFIAGTQLPKESKKFVLPKEIKKQEKNEQERLAYSQFKKISDNRGDSVQATEFLALEMDAYFKQIVNQKGKRGEQFNLWLNKFSSNWGNDWVRAVLVTLGINSFCFLCYCLCLGYTLGKDLGLFGKLASYSLEFLNPLRKSDFLQAEVTPLARVVDYTSRIIVAYFTYQTIQAFRRFGKK